MGKGKAKNAAPKKSTPQKAEPAAEKKEALAEEKAAVSEAVNNEEKVAVSEEKSEAVTNDNKDETAANGSVGQKMAVVGMLAAFGGALIGGGGFYLKYKSDIKFAEKFSILKEADELLEESKAKKVEPEKTDEYLLNGYLGAYDKFTFYTPPRTQRDIELEFVNKTPCLPSCGYEVDLNDDGIIVISSVRPGSSAEEQGLCVGDKIVEIDGIDVTVDALSNIRSLTGKDGTTMKLVLDRGGERVSIDYVRVVSQEDSEDCVKAKMLDDDVLYINISSFAMDVDWAFGRNAQSYFDNAKSVIIDVRENPGGLAPGAVNIANKFITEGRVVMHPYTGEEKTYEVIETGKKYDIPVVVLANENSASAAEIFIDLMKLHCDKATIVGVTTYGKGVYQENRELSNGGTLRWTLGYYFIDDNESYDGIGVEPDITVEMDPELIGTDDDVQLQKALELLG